MMDFDEWFYPSASPKAAWDAGQQSKQAEIDALQGKIDKVLYAIAQSELHGDRAIWGIQDEIKELLK